MTTIVSPMTYAPGSRIRSPKVYYYTDKEVGVTWPGPDADFIVNGKPKVPGTPWPRFNWCAFPGFEETTNANKADIFVVRQRLIWLSTEQIYGLPHLRPDNANRHVFFDLGSDGVPECFRDFPDLPAIFFRAAANKHMMRGTPTTVPWSWPVEDFSGYALEPKGGFQYDVVYQGQDAATVRHTARTAVNVLENASGFAGKHLVITPHFYGTMRDGAERKRLRESFLDTMHHGRLSLVPGCHPFGVTRYRFYEALSMGRVPVYIENNGTLPFEEQINYRRCALFVPEEFLPGLGENLCEWLAQHSDKEILEMGAYGREMWKRWMDRARWAEIIAETVRAKLSL